MILERKFKEESEIWEKELRSGAFVHVNDPTLLKAGFNLDQGRPIK